MYLVGVTRAQYFEYPPFFVPIAVTTVWIVAFGFCPLGGAGMGSALRQKVTERRCRPIRSFQLHRGFGFQPNVFDAWKKGRWTLGKRTVNRLSSRSNTELGSGAVVFEGATKRTSNAESVICYVDAMRGFETALGDTLTIGRFQYGSSHLAKIPRLGIGRRWCSITGCWLKI